ncbi:MAG: Arc family DNA-binding protein [Asticcacaulis sp.]|uniref:Arc family DNA-binding protein n=1 Tax=Asticcacaulis sp. TaxID=1872648 RepID=UPI003F7CAB0A
MASPGKKAYPLRLPPEVLKAVERLAASELRSTNAQLEMLLREALAKRGVRLTKPGDAD